MLRNILLLVASFVFLYFAITFHGHGHMNICKKVESVEPIDGVYCYYHTFDQERPIIDSCHKFTIGDTIKLSK